MARPIEILKSRSLLEKAEVVDALWLIVQEWCFAVMRPISSYVYSSSDAFLKQRYNIICDNIIRGAKEAVLRAMSTKDEEAFIAELKSLPEFVYRQVGMLCTTLEIDQPVYEDALIEDLRYVYFKFVSKKKKEKKAKKEQGS